MLFGRHEKHLPTAGEALKGRPEPAFELPERHTVLGNPLHGPYPEGLETADFAMGCFWGAERVFWQADGVWTTLAGYQGGYTENPSYEEVCSGMTGHAEAVRVVFDPAKTSYETLLKLFWESHDPTQGYRQGNDVGTQYRSAIFPLDEEQERKARDAMERANASLGGRVVTTIEPMREWWPAEAYHQEYWEGEGQRNPYCLATIPPKLQKLRKSFQARMKSEAAA